MPQIVLDATGVPKASLVAGAYEFCGLNGQEYERTPEEIATGMRHLNALMSALLKKGVDLSYTFPTYGVGLPEEPSGIPDDAVEPVHALLAQRLAPTIGASLSDDCKAILSGAVQDLLANYAATPPAMVPAGVMPSSGIRHRRFTSLVPVTPPDTDPGDLAGLLGG